jgi:hypothetical protein
MIKYLLLSGLIVLLCGPLCAQQLQLGIKGGALFSKFTGISFNNGYKAGYEGGGFVRYLFTRRWQVQAEVVFSAIHAAKSDGFDKVYNNKQNLSAASSFSVYHLNIPVLVSYPLYRNLRVLAGPQLGIRTFSNEDLFRNKTGAFRPLDLSVSGGLQWDLKALAFYARCTWGLTNTNHYDDRDAWKRRQLAAGVEIPVFRK